MKKMILTVMLVGLFLYASTCFAQELKGWEWDVYYDLVEENYTSSIPSGEGYFDKVKSKIANKHGITLEKLEDILYRGADRAPTQREWDIAGDLANQIVALGDNASDYDYKRVYQRVADKYGITLRELYDINYRTMEWGMF